MNQTEIISESNLIRAEPEEPKETNELEKPKKTNEKSETNKKTETVLQNYIFSPLRQEH